MASPNGASKSGETGLWPPSGEPVSTEQIRANVRRNAQRGLPEPGRARGTVNICAGGSSLDPKKIKGRKQICAVNQAHDHLIEHGVIPHWCVLVDPVPGVADLITPHPGVEYFVASQCDPAVFDKLAGYTVRLFHIGNSAPIDDLVSSSLRVDGGTGAIHRALSLHWLRGCTVFHLWGFDCSGQHAYAHRVNPGPEGVPVELFGQTYVTTPGLLRQARSFFRQLRNMNAIRPPVVHVHGDGLVAALMRTHGRRTVLDCGRSG